MLTQAQIIVGQVVTLRTDSQWFAKGDNPSDSLTQGSITGVDGEWINVHWPGSQEPLNYKSFDLDAA